MEGPRPVAEHELESLARLVDTVFVGGESGRMFHSFPTLFRRDNLDNLLVFVEGEDVVSHVGMVYRWATLGGCTVRVACMGAVSTCERLRGQGLASQLFHAACEKARHDGVDFMMISGDRPLYMENGAAHVGRDRRVVITRDVADMLRLRDVDIRPYQESDLADCMAAYGTKPARFIRPRDDWEAFLSHRQCGGEATWTVVRREGLFCGYLIHAPGPEPGSRRVGEWAGDGLMVASALGPLLDECGADRVTLQAQSVDRILVDALDAAGATLAPCTTTGTYLILHFTQLMERLRPYFETILGVQPAARLGFEGDHGHYVIHFEGESLVLENKADVARLVFGQPEGSEHQGFTESLFPVPTLCYGLNYI